MVGNAAARLRHAAKLVSLPIIVIWKYLGQRMVQVVYLKMPLVKRRCSQRALRILELLVSGSYLQDGGLSYIVRASPQLL